MRKLGKIAVVAGVAAMVVSTAVPALAANKNRLHLYGGEGGTANWVQSGGSPAEANPWALKFTGPNLGTDYAVAYANRQAIGLKKGVPVGKVKNLSFDFSSANTFGGGSPRISVGVDIDGGGIDAYAYLSAEYCDQDTIGDTPDWHRADFTGSNNTYGPCYLWFDNVQYSGTATDSPWKVFATAHPSYIVRTAYMVADWNTADTYVDRLALNKRMYGAKNFTTVCKIGGVIDESAC